MDSKTLEHSTPAWAELPEEVLAECRFLAIQVRALLKPDATEDQIWEAIASTDPNWSAVRLSLRNVDAEWQRLHRPENISLGTIGRALDSPEFNTASAQLAEAIGRFTAVDEALLERPGYALLLKHLLQQKREADEALAPAPVIQEETPLRPRGFLGSIFGRKKLITPAAGLSRATAPSSPGSES